MTRTPLIEALAQLKYPTSLPTAATDWNISLEAAQQRLIRGRGRGLLYKSGRQYIPTEKALDAWVEAGLV